MDPQNCLWNIHIFQFRSKLCEGPEDCVDDGNTVRVGTEILKTLPCPPCPEQSEKSFGENSNLVPLSKQCHVEGSGEVICICPYGICKDDKEKSNQCDGGKCDQVLSNIFYKSFFPIIFFLLAVAKHHYNH